MDFIKLAETRYSVRKFSPQPVEKEKIEQILHAAQVAPSACNNQPWKIFVLQRKEALERANRCSPYIYGAPLVFLVCYDLTEQYASSKNELNFGLIDATIAMTHMVLAATEVGLGSCWIGEFAEDQTNELFALSDSLEPAGFLAVGYAAMSPGPKHSIYKSLDQLAEWD